MVISIRIIIVSEDSSFKDVSSLLDERAAVPSIGSGVAFVVRGDSGGSRVGFRVGEFVGSGVGFRVGSFVGDFVGSEVGFRVGGFVGDLVGSGVGFRVGGFVGG